MCILEYFSFIDIKRKRLEILLLKKKKGQNDREYQKKGLTIYNQPFSKYVLINL